MQGRSLLLKDATVHAALLLLEDGLAAYSVDDAGLPPWA